MTAAFVSTASATLSAFAIRAEGNALLVALASDDVVPPHPRSDGESAALPTQRLRRSSEMSTRASACESRSESAADRIAAQRESCAGSLSSARHTARTRTSSESSLDRPPAELHLPREPPFGATESRSRPRFSRTRARNAHAFDPYRPEQPVVVVFELKRSGVEIHGQARVASRCRGGLRSLWSSDRNPPFRASSGPGAGSREEDLGTGIRSSGGTPGNRDSRSAGTRCRAHSPIQKPI